MNIKTYLLLIKIKLIIILFFFIYSCQPVNNLEQIVFDNDLLNKISISAEKKSINHVYEIKYLDPYIDNTINPTAIIRLSNWLEDNVNVFGSQNILVINIIEASLTRIERSITNKKFFSEKSEFYYEIKFMIEFILYDDNDYILATTNVDVKRSTTSSKYLSLNEKENITNSLVLEALKDTSSKSEEMLKQHMFEFFL